MKIELSPKTAEILRRALKGEVISQMRYLSYCKSCGTSMDGQAKLTRKEMAETKKVIRDLNKI